MLERQEQRQGDKLVEKGGDCFPLCLEVELVEIAKALDVELKGGERIKVSGLSNGVTREVPLTKTK